MSILETPRIYFKGEMAWDPIVTNNTTPFYNETTGETVYPSVQNKVAAFRKEAIASVIPAPHLWNVDGTHRSIFFDTAVNGCDLGEGTNVKDPFIKASAHFQGMLVDLEPYGIYTSQLFFDQMRFGVKGGYSIIAPRTSRFTARYVNFSRTAQSNAIIAGVASVVWQTSFAKTDGLAIEAFDSPILKALDKALKDRDVLGLTVRFNAYHTIYFNNPDLTKNTPAQTEAELTTLAAKLALGGFQPNPARSLLVGTIGLWRAGEPVHEPGDRTLVSLPALNSPVASAHARATQATLTLDLSNSVSEIDQDLTKQDLGTLSVVAVDTDGKTVATLGLVPYTSYDRDAYEASAGIVTVPLTDANAQYLAGNNLQINKADGTVLLTELPLRAIPATPNFYLDQYIGPEATMNATTTFQVYDRGQPATSGITVNLYTINVDTGSVTGTPVPVTTDANGLITWEVAQTEAGISAFVPSCSAADVPQPGINSQVTPYMYVRVRPADANIAALLPNWENLYCQVLANWNAMAPCMDNWLRLDDPKQIKAYAAMLKRLTDPANFEDFRFMPVTRDMSAGQRTLLYAFLDADDDATSDKQVMDDICNPAIADKQGAENVSAPSLADLSRAMRNLQLY